MREMTLSWDDIVAAAEDRRLTQCITDASRIKGKVKVKSWLGRLIRVDLD